MQIEMTELNKTSITNKGLYYYLEGKYFISTYPHLERILIKNITTKDDKINILCYKNITNYEVQFDSIMKLFEFYYNEGYRLEL